MKKYLLPLLTAGLLASACAQTGQQRADEADAGQSAEQHILMAELAVQQHDFAEAARQYALALRKSDDPELAARAGPMVFDYGSYDDALSAAQRWIALDATAVQPRRELASLYLQRGRVGKAMPELEWLFQAVSAETDQGFRRAAAPADRER